MIATQKEAGKLEALRRNQGALNLTSFTDSSLFQIPDVNSQFDQDLNYEITHEDMR